MAHYTNGDVPRPFAPAALLRSVALLLPGGARIALAVLVAPVQAAGQSPVGPETCKACHPSAYEAWRETPHARAQESLPPKSRKDPRCTTCHAPDLEKGVAAVSCEACHGPGQHYAALHVMRDPELARLVGLADPGERTCLRCHTESAPSLAPFDPRARMRFIAHGREGSTGPSAPSGAPPPAPAPSPARPPPPPAARER